MNEALSNIRIVPMTADHIIEVAKIENEVFRDPWPRSGFLEILSLSDKCWCAVCGKKPLGYLITQWILDEIHVLNIAVAVEAHRKGIASEMLSMLFREGLAGGMQDIFLEVRVSNESAIALYKRFGFEEIVVRKKYYQDGENALVMHCKLAADPADADAARTENETEA
jgi:[ribosomal protein S18]-alanine N-acetyltransferase